MTHPATRSSIAPETVKSHVKNIFAKLGVDRRADAAVRAETFGLIGPK
jgi:LuxR family maltose regulon positive regulatory protein